MTTPTSPTTRATALRPASGRGGTSNGRPASRGTSGGGSARGGLERAGWGPLFEFASPSAVSPEGGAPEGAAPVPRLLLTGPPGAGKSRRALDLFDEAVRRDGPDAALLVLPTYGQVEHAKRLAISRRGDRPDVRGLLDVSYATFTSLRERLAPGFRVRGLPSRRRRDLLAAEALAAADSPLFRPVRDRPGFRSRFLRLVKELKQTGEEPASLLARARTAAGALDDGPRERLLGFLEAWACYEGLLAAALTPDHEDALRALVTELGGRAASVGALRLVVVDGFDDFSGVEARLLEAVTAAVVAAGGRIVVTLPWDERRADLFPSTASLRARLVTGLGFVERPVPGFARSVAPALSRLAANLFAPDGVPVVAPRAGAAAASLTGAAGAADVGPAADSDVAAPDDGVGVIVGADPADEWDRIGREILRRVRGGLGFRDVGVIVRRLDGIAPMARRVLEALGIPVRLVGGGESLATEAVVRAVRGPLRLLGGDDGEDERDFDALSLLDWLRWRALDSGDPLDVDEVDATDLRWRRLRLPLTWRDLCGDLRAKAPGTLAPAVDRLEALRAELRGSEAHADAEPSILLERVVAELLPLRASSGLDVDGRPRDPAADARLARARTAKRRLLALVAEAAPKEGETHAGPASPTFSDLVDDLLAATNDASCEPADRRLDAVSVLDAEEARHWELPVVFVAGLVEKGFPLHPREDLFLRDEDRAALAARLARDGDGAAVPWRTARDAEVSERRLFLTAVTRARVALVLSRSARDERGRETAPSFFWRDAAKALGRPPEGRARFGRDPDDLDRATPSLVDVATEEDLLRFVASTGAGRAAGHPSDPRIAAWLARARRFRREVADALPASATAAFLAATKRLSPSRIQAASDCPHRFFLASVAKVPEDDAPLRGTSADRRRFGTWIHRALEKAVRAPDATPDELVAEVMAEASADVPDDADRAWYAEDLKRIVTLFRLREAAARASGYEPHARDVEIAFGEGADDADRGGAAKGHEVRLGAGAGEFVLSGRIDRLDTNDAAAGPRRAIVVDYKTTASTAAGAARGLLRSEELQLALYARAIEQVRGVTVVGVEHYAAMQPMRAATADERAEAAFQWRRDDGRPATVLATEDFEERFLRGAERRASEVVATVRKGADGGHVKSPLDRARCERCGFRDVCRPDVRRFALVAARPEDVESSDDDEGDDA